MPKGARAGRHGVSGTLVCVKEAAARVAYGRRLPDGGLDVSVVSRADSFERAMLKDGLERVAAAFDGCILSASVVVSPRSGGTRDFDASSKRRRGDGCGTPERKSSRAISVYQLPA
jgi:hypothetical protein